MEAEVAVFRSPSDPAVETPGLPHTVGHSALSAPALRTATFSRNLLEGSPLGCGNCGGYCRVATVPRLFWILCSESHSREQNRTEQDPRDRCKPSEVWCGGLAGALRPRRGRIDGHGRPLAGSLVSMQCGAIETTVLTCFHLKKVPQGCLAEPVQASHRVFQVFYFDDFRVPYLQVIIVRRDPNGRIPGTPLLGDRCRAKRTAR